MRLAERTLQEIGIVRRVVRIGPLGGRTEAFSDEQVLVRGSVLPDGGGLDVGEGGLESGVRLRLLVPADTAVQAGDGAYVDGKLYLVRGVSCWSAHLELECEAKA